MLGKNVRKELSEHPESLWVKLIQICGKLPETFSIVLSVYKQGTET